MDMVLLLLESVKSLRPVLELAHRFERETRVGIIGVSARAHSLRSSARDGRELAGDVLRCERAPPTAVGFAGF
jgi:hypothetical protein